MTHWWPGAFPTYPWGTWFWAEAHYGSGFHLPTPPYTYHWLWFYKIPPSGGHFEQLAYKSLVDLPTWWAGGTWVIRANVTYILTKLNDTPNWGNTSLVRIGPPCGNWYSALYMTTEITRNQSCAMDAAIQANRSLSVGLDALIAQIEELTLSVAATFQKTYSLSVGIDAAIAYNFIKNFAIRTAIKTDRSLTPGLYAAIAEDHELEISMLATLQRTGLMYSPCRAAIQGETAMQSGFTAYIMQSRKEAIKLEIEGITIQEFALNSIQNWPSSPKDYRRDTIGG